MATRRQNPEEHTFRQDAFSSSAEFERGILGNLVAARCDLVSDPETIAVIWWLQQVSWREGGLAGFAANFLHQYARLIGTHSMHKFGRAAGQIYSADQVVAVRSEIRKKYGNAADDFPLKGKPTRRALLAAQVERVESGQSAFEERRAEVYAEADNYPDSYSVADFLECCEMEPREFADELKRLLVNPSTSLEGGLWNMPHLLSALKECRLREATEAACRIVPTEVTKVIAEELDFAFEERAFVVIEGREGIGKSEAALTWCASHPGQAIYIKLESGTDEMGFMRSLARAAGTATSIKLKVFELKARVQDALQRGHLALVLDESHFLWPQSDRAERKAPKRVDWLRTALVDCGVPVALITTPQYFATQCDRFRKGGWNANQVQRRIARTVALPEELSIEDIKDVARRSFPTLCDRTLTLAAATALGSVGYLTTISHIKKRSDFLLRRRPGINEEGAVLAVLKEMGLDLSPSDEQTPAASSEEPVKTRLTAPQPVPLRGREASPVLTGGRIPARNAVPV